MQRLKKTAFLESAVYNPQNYLFNTNYNREFGDKIRSEGANYLRSLGAKQYGPGPGSGALSPAMTRNMAATAANTAQPSSRASENLQAGSKITNKLNKKDLDLKRNAIKLRLNTHAFRNFKQVGACNFNSSSVNNRDHNLSTSPTRKKSTPSLANAKYFEHLKGQQHKDSHTTVR